MLLTEQLTPLMRDPPKGLYLGSATSDLSAVVTMSRLGPQASARA